MRLFVIAEPPFVLRRSSKSTNGAAVAALESSGERSAGVRAGSAALKAVDDGVSFGDGTAVFQTISVGSQYPWQLKQGEQAPRRLAGQPSGGLAVDRAKRLARGRLKPDDPVGPGRLRFFVASHPPIISGEHCKS